MNLIALITIVGGGVLIGSGIWFVYKWKTVTGICLIVGGLVLVVLPFVVSFLLASKE
jgi:hypothetical protein